MALVGIAIKTSWPDLLGSTHLQFSLEKMT